MKGIDKQKLIDLIETLELEHVSITGDVDMIDVSSPNGKEYIINPTGKYYISIRGYDPKP